MKVKILYFASLKERLLKGEDTVEVPEDVKTVEDLINYLSENDAALKAAFEEMPRLRFAVNQEMAKESTVSEGRRRSGLLPAGYRRLIL